MRALSRQDAPLFGQVQMERVKLCQLRSSKCATENTTGHERGLPDDEVGSTARAI